MNIPLLNAISYLGIIESGVSRPIKCLCKNEELQSEYAVKLKTKVNDGILSLCSEVIATKLANALNIDTPDIAIINLSEEFANLVEELEISREILANVGINFGSKLISGNTTWIRGQSITRSILQPAFETLMFDAMIQNPDRTLVKPNFLINKNRIYLIDHEKGFSFVRDLFHKHSPWEVSKLSFLKNHIFYPELKKNNIAEYFDIMEDKLKVITEKEIENIFLNIPEEWNNDHLIKIKNHLLEIFTNSNKFIQELKILLA